MKKIGKWLFRGLVNLIWLVILFVMVMTIQTALNPPKQPTRNVFTDGYSVLNGPKQGQYSNFTIISVGDEQSLAIYIAYFDFSNKTVTQTNKGETGIPEAMEAGSKKQLTTKEGKNLGTVSLEKDTFYWDPPENLPVNFIYAGPPP